MRFHLDEEDSQIVTVVPVQVVCSIPIPDDEAKQVEPGEVEEKQRPRTLGDDVVTAEPEPSASRRCFLALHRAVLAILSPQTLKVCGITLANGADNISIYVALLASATGSQIGITLAVFYVMLAVWLAASWMLLKVPPVAKAIGHYGEYIVPLALMALGVYIMYDADCISLVA